MGDKAKNTRDVVVSLTVRVNDDVDNEQLAARIQEALAPLSENVDEAGELFLHTASHGESLTPKYGYEHRLWSKATCG
ncbi:hypothetical protein A4G26_22315 [Mycobacterium kansasii]|uniref:Uncharacterized protein n=1 Tax=Mycobacterium innocens TaxID=2341083 RepID=A0A498PZT3_9MYCO|nr:MULTISPECIES: hypothetical protein [Mycobacterium]KZS75495.1 hypothetical protein A4G26_22315 [Mycobacterium kansasii]VBA39338.1 hypothetical protein LAUMK13_02542 [Mycobacterium innocens]